MAGRGRPPCPLLPLAQHHLHQAKIKKKKKKRITQLQRQPPRGGGGGGSRLGASESAPLLGREAAEAVGRGRRQSSRVWGEAEPPEAAPAAARISPAAPQPRRRWHVCAQATSQPPPTAAAATEGLTRQNRSLCSPPPPGGATPGPARPHSPGPPRQTAGRGRRSADSSRADGLGSPQWPRGARVGGWRRRAWWGRGWRRARRRRAPGAAGRGMPGRASGHRRTRGPSRRRVPAMTSRLLAPLPGALAPGGGRWTRAKPGPEPPPGTGRSNLPGRTEGRPENPGWSFLPCASSSSPGKPGRGKATC